MSLKWMLFGVANLAGLAAYEAVAVKMPWLTAILIGACLAFLAMSVDEHFRDIRNS